MFARVSSYEGSPDRIDDLVAGIQQTTDTVRQMDGFQQAFLLVDRGGGRALTITLWDAERSLQASAEQANRVREQAANHGGFRITGVDAYEVALQLEGAG